MILLSFGFAIMIGTILLMLPIATTTGRSLGIIDALFTATSAICVTGLIVVDTGTALSPFGQLVVLLLVQLGGLGIMTLSTFFIYLLSGRLSLPGREILIDRLSQNPVADLTKLLKIVFLFTLTIELAGAFILTIRFSQNFAFDKAIYYGVFHSISAFCNSGFSLFSNSFIDYQPDLLINIVLIILIILGGIGFLVIMDLYKNPNPLVRKYFRKLSFHSRLVLLSTLVFLVAGTLLFLWLEYNNSLKEMFFTQKLLVSFFQSVTTRTAGFNTINIYDLTNSTLFLFIILMFIGASPGSCGGGIKNTTFTLLILSIIGRFRMKKEVNIFYRRIPEPTLSRVYSIVFFSFSIITLATFLLLSFELKENSHSNSKNAFLELLFEAISAFGTVGLSTGITPSLSPLGKLMITLLMFVGRLGPLTIALAVKGKDLSPKFKYVQEDVMVG